MLGGLFNVHKLPEDPAAQCGEIDMKGFGLAQAMIFAVEKINNDSYLLPNISLGYDIQDYCENITEAARIAYKLLKDGVCPKVTRANTGKKPIVALVGPFESRTALFIGGFLRMLNVSGISGTTTSVELSSPSYNHMYRTVPSDRFLAKAMVDIIELFDWGYVAAVGLDDSYGRNGVWSVISEAASRTSSFCIAMTEFIRHEAQSPSITYIVEKLKKHENIKVVILWLPFNYQQKFFAVVNRHNLTRRFWIISEIYLTLTSKENEFLHSSFSVLEGSIGFLPHDFNYYGFKEHMKNIFITEESKTTLKELGYIQDKERNCSNRNNRRTEQYWNISIDEIYSAFVPYTIDAIYSMAHALHLITKDSNANTTSNRQNCSINVFDMQGLLRRVNFTGITGKIEFDQFGDSGSAFYDIFNFQKVSEGNGKRLKMVLVGKWEKHEKNKTQLRFHQEVLWNTPSGSPPKSECSEQCPPGTRISSTSPCCWQCVPCPGDSINAFSDSKSCKECPTGSMSNNAKTECVALPSANLRLASVGGIFIIAFSTLGLVLTLFSVAAMYKFWNSPVVKASNREVSLALLLSIISLYSLVVINVFEPTDTICKTIYPLRYLTHNLCLSLLLAKILRISSVFQVPVVGSLTISPLSSRIQAVIVISLQLFLLLMFLPWLLLDPPVNIKHVHPGLYTFVECKAYKMLVGKIIYFLTCSFIFIQMLLSALCSFKVRNIPENFSDAKRTAFSLYIFMLSLLCYYLPALLMDKWYVTVLDCVTTLLSAYGFLCCIFLPKLYIMFFRPQMNNLTNISQEVTQFSFRSSRVRVNPAFDTSTQQVQT